MSDVIIQVLEKVRAVDVEMANVVSSAIRTVMWSDWESNGEAPEMAEGLKMFEEAQDDLNKALKKYKEEKGKNE